MASSKALLNLTSLKDDDLPWLEQSHYKLESLVDAQVQRDAMLDVQIAETRSKSEAAREFRKTLGAPRSFIRGIGSNAIFMAMTQHYAKKKKIREQDRDRAIKAHDRVMAYNEEVREGINELRKIKLSQEAQFKKLQAKLEVVKAEMVHVLAHSNALMDEKDEITAKIEELKETNEQEEKAHRNDLTAFDAYVSEYLERTAPILEGGVKQEMIAVLSKDESDGIQKQMSRLRDTMSLELDLEKTSVQHVHEYQTAFDKLKHMSGISNLNRLVESFIDTEDRNFAEFRYIQEVNEEVRNVEVERDSIVQRIELLRQSAGSESAQKLAEFKRLQQTYVDLQMEVDAVERRLTHLRDAVHPVNAAIKSMFHTCGLGTADFPMSPGPASPGGPPSPIRPQTSQSSFSYSDGRPATSQSTRRSSLTAATLSRMDVTGSNLVEFLAVIEKGVADLSNDYAHLIEREDLVEDIAGGKGPAAPPKLKKAPTQLVLPDVDDDAEAPAPEAGASMRWSLPPITTEGSHEGDLVDFMDSSGPGLEDPAQRSLRRLAATTSRFDMTKPIDVNTLKREIAAQFQGPDGLDPSMFTIPEPTERPNSSDSDLRGRLRKKRSFSLNRTAPANGVGKNASTGALRATTAVDSRRKGVRFA